MLGTKLLMKPRQGIPADKTFTFHEECFELLSKRVPATEDMDLQAELLCRMPASQRG